MFCFDFRACGSTGFGADELAQAALSVPYEDAISVRSTASFTRRSDAFAAQNTSTCLLFSVYDGFEGQTLGNIWQTILLAPGALRLQSRIVRAGHGAVEITLHARDKFERGVNGDSDSERDELCLGSLKISIKSIGFFISVEAKF